MIGATRFARLNPQVFTVRFRTLGGERLSLGISDNNTTIARTDIAVGFRACSDNKPHPAQAETASSNSGEQIRDYFAGLR